MIAGLTPATPPDARAATAPELKERLASLGYVARSGASSKTSFTAEEKTGLDALIQKVLNAK